MPSLSPDGQWFYLRANTEAPYAYDYRSVTPLKELADEFVLVDTDAVCAAIRDVPLPCW